MSAKKIEFKGPSKEYMRKRIQEGSICCPDQLCGGTIKKHRKNPLRGKCDECGIVCDENNYDKLVLIYAIKARHKSTKELACVLSELN